MSNSTDQIPPASRAQGEAAAQARAPGKAAAPRPRGRALPATDPHGELVRQLYRLMPMALRVMEKHMESGDDKLAHSAATKIFGLRGLLDKPGAGEGLLVAFQGQPKPDLPRPSDSLPLEGDPSGEA